MALVETREPVHYRSIPGISWAGTAARPWCCSKWYAGVNELGWAPMGEGQGRVVQ
jgi:hypothetical protein